MRKAPVILALALVALAGCGEEPGGGDAAAGSAGDAFCGPLTARVDSFVAARSAGWEPPSERYGGTAVVSGGADLSGMNAISASDDYTTVQHQNHVHLMTLVRYDEKLEPVPYLAESWEVAPDSSSIVFNLRDDVYWHDGVKTTAEDVAFTYELMTDPEAAFPNPSYWERYERGPGAVEVIDSFTVRVGMQGPHPEFLDPWRTSSIVPRHLLEGVPASELAQHPWGQRCWVGNGPFVVEDRTVGESWTFAANPAFPEELGGRPYLDRLVYRVVAEPATALSELLVGRTHVYVQLPPDYSDEVEEAEDVRLVRFPHRTYTFVGWNLRRPQLADARVRRALTLATDREEMVEALQRGFAEVAQSTVYPSHWAYDDTFEDVLAYDVEAARRLLEEAGWTDRDGDGVRENADGLPLAISLKYNGDNQIRRDIAEIMQSQLAAVGVEATPTSMEYQTLIQSLTDPERRDFDGVVLAFSNDFRMDDAPLFHSESLDDLFGFAGLDDPRMDHLLDTLQIVVDRDAARALWVEYQRLLVEEQPFTFIYFADWLAGVSEGLGGVEMDSRGEWISVREWWLDPEARSGGR